MIKLNDKVYNILKWITLIVIPALTTFYCTVDLTFGWGFSDIVATISSAFCAMIGTIIGISTLSYNKQN